MYCFSLQVPIFLYICAIGLDDVRLSCLDCAEVLKKYDFMSLQYKSLRAIFLIGSHVFNRTDR